ncbi:hypothetical protein ACPPVO_49400 [Dactylosporangium sp. McL0621]|uniref:hypothetical protein n=1 Tax=Dactylosporangium sp. McL0621 TaxID=3415678 RepID=UPI003CEAE890
MPQGSGTAPFGRRPARRARHRRINARRRGSSDGWAFLVAAAVLGMLAVSGWYTASGANAVAQMLAR